MSLQQLRTATQLGAGGLVQVVLATSTSALSGSATMVKASAPTNTQGIQIMTASITPKAATNRLVVGVETPIYNVGGNYQAVALFRDSGANAIRTYVYGTSNSANWTTCTFFHEVVAGSTAMTTFAVRTGNESAISYYVNQFTAAENYGGTLQSRICIWELAA